MRINANYLNLKDSYLFAKIGRKAAEYRAANPGKKVISLGIGDVTQPLCPAVTEAMKRAADELSVRETFRGYGPEQGYDFLREAVAGYYKRRGVSLSLNEIFVSDGAKSDIGNVLDIFDRDNTVIVSDPVYPVYVDTNIMAGREVVFAPATEENGFLPMPDESVKADIIYLCSPNNPTGAAMSREQLGAWVDYANSLGAVILFDAAYEAFAEGDVPRSIFEIEGARTCAIEFCSLSKTAGFTGVRCGYTVVPEELERGGAKLNRLWNRRQTTKFNGVSYVVQRGAEAVFSEDGLRQTAESIAYYKANAALISDALNEMGVWHTGGKHSPYVFLKCFKTGSSWDFFDMLLNEASVVGTPGAGFGECGEGYFRLTAFNTRENTAEAIERIKKLL